MLTLHQFEISPFCDKIRRVLNVKRIPYQTREVGLLESQMGYRKLNPIGKVPTIVDDDGTVVADSTDIAYYLEERHPAPPLGVDGREDARAGAPDLGRHLDALAVLLAGRDYLVGSVLTLADIAVFAQLFAIRDSSEGGAAVLAHREVNAFMERVEQATGPEAASRAA
jgi:glutathione S-transferase